MSAPRTFMAYGRPSTPAPTTAVTLCTVDQYLPFQPNNNLGHLLSRRAAPVTDAAALCAQQILGRSRQRLHGAQGSLPEAHAPTVMTTMVPE